MIFRLRPAEAGENPEICLILDGKRDVFAYYYGLRAVPGEEGEDTGPQPP